MARSAIFSLLVAVCGIFFVSASAVQPLWPKPSDAQLGSTLINLDSSFNFILKTQSDLLDKAVKRYNEIVAVPAGATGTLKSCSVSFDKSAADGPAVGSDESYSVTIDEKGNCKISAGTEYGAMHGMETFTQLLTRSADSKEVLMSYAPVTISDTPRYGHRGLLIDTARHYLPVEAIRSVIDSLSTSKFNVLHWHAVDAESFPLQTPSAPTMVNGAYSPTMIYTMDNLADLNSYAHDRGVDIVFEVDVPGHAASWTKGDPTIMADCFAKYYYNINDFALNPTLDETYTVLGSILSDIVNATGVRNLHIGGDEVVYGCWKEDASITQFMSEHSWTDYDQLMNYFVQKADGIVKNLGAKVTHWEEVFSAGCDVAADTVFQVWTNSDQMSLVTAANYQVIASPSDYWYLNIATNTWQVMYGYDPVQNLDTAAQKNLVIGGEAALWGEYVDENNILQSIYPRASAVGERLWSPQETTDLDDAEARLLIQRCRLVARGIPSAPVKPGFCDTQYV